MVGPYFDSVAVFARFTGRAVGPCSSLRGRRVVGPIHFTSGSKDLQDKGHRSNSRPAIHETATTWNSLSRASLEPLRNSLSCLSLPCGRIGEHPSVTQAHHRSRPGFGSGSVQLPAPETSAQSTRHESPYVFFRCSMQPNQDEEFAIRCRCQHFEGYIYQKTRQQDI